MRSSCRAASLAKTSTRVSFEAGGKPAPCGMVEGLVNRNRHPEARAWWGAAQFIEVVKAGLPVMELEVLQASLGLPMDKLVPKLGMSKATFHRRKIQGRLGREESDHVLRFARLMGKATEVFESEQNALLWLASAQIGLGGATPLDYAETEVGSREVEDLLGRIEYGVYS